MSLDERRLHGPLEGLCLLSCGREIKDFFETLSLDLGYKEAQGFWDFGHKNFYCILGVCQTWYFIVEIHILWYLCLQKVVILKVVASLGSVSVTSLTKHSPFNWETSNGSTFQNNGNFGFVWVFFWYFLRGSNLQRQS